MSGIAGIYFRDGRPVESDTLEAMRSALAHRGPDGSGAWIEGPVGLAHLLLWTTPESMREQQPLSRGDLVLIADARIDNREELITLLALDKSAQESITDSDLILTAYQRWGRACTDHLLGDFAFAIWDKGERRLFCARDHSGVKPFYYYLSEGVFAFASEIRALLKLRDVPARLNNQKIADYLMDLYMMYVDNITTFYRDIFRLPPAHQFVIDPASADLRCYWSLDPNREIRLGSDQEYAEALREVFTEAVRCRLRSAFPVGSMLSGGLDSSSIVCVARKLLPAEKRLHTFFCTYRVPECDESPFARAVVAQGGLDHHDLPWPGLFDGAENALRYQDEPLWIHSVSLYWHVCMAARDQGVRVLLDGDDGDTTLSHGFGYFSELAFQNRWDTFIAKTIEAAQLSLRSKDDFLPFATPYLTDLFRRGHWLEGISAINKLAVAFSVSRSKLVRDSLRPIIPGPVLSLWRAAQGHSTPPGELMSQRLLEQIGPYRIPEPPLIQSEREDHIFQLMRGTHRCIIEEAGRMAAPFSIEERHPFRDKRLIEFCVALPPQQKTFQGWPRIAMRRAMQDILPPEVQWRPDKTEGQPNAAYLLVNFDQPLVEATLRSSLADVADYLDLSYLRELSDQLGAVQTYTDLLLPGKSRIIDVIEKAMLFILWKRARVSD